MKGENGKKSLKEGKIEIGDQINSFVADSHKINHT